MRLRSQLLEKRSDGEWSTIFGWDFMRRDFGLCMPFCDKSTPLPLMKPEQRPFRPLGVWRVVVQPVEHRRSLPSGVSVERLFGPNDMVYEAWIGMPNPHPGMRFWKWLQTLTKRVLGWALDLLSI